MAPNPRVLSAFRAMRELGIAEEKVKPVLKSLIKLYEKNWELIEEENYRALADAIFDAEETQAAEQKKKIENTEREEVLEEPEVQEERPLKRLRLRHQEGQPSPSVGNSSSSALERSNTSQLGAADSAAFTRRRKEKGKEPLLPESAPGERSADRPSPALRLKEPKVEPGIVPLPRERTLALIKPKDEPVTDDVPQFEVPIAVIRPESRPRADSSEENESSREGGAIAPLTAQSVQEKEQNDGIPDSTNQTRSNYELATIPDKSTANLEIASSPSGEIKISVSCNSAFGGPDFRTPSVDRLLKTVEDKCLRSYKVLDPNFSVKQLMKDMCECFLELGSDSSNEQQVAINVTPPIDLLPNCCAADTVGTNGMPCDANGSANIQADNEMSLPQIPRLPPPSNCVDDSAQAGMESNGEDCENAQEIEHNGFEDRDSRTLVVVPPQLTPDDLRSLHDMNDIAKGQEKVIISLVNEINTERPPPFHYIPKNAVFQNAYVNFPLARIGDDNCCSTCFGDCLSLSTPCACALQSGGEFAYTSEGLVKEEILDECISMNRHPQKHCLFYCKECPLERSKNEEILEPCKGHLLRSFIKECWWKCGCNKQCGNRVVQRGITRNLQVFMTPGGKGWGLRTLEELPKGAFVCEYVGEILTNSELYDRVSRSSNKDEHAYPVLLDADWGAESALKDEEALCLDATLYGNVARFINHRCLDSNLVEIPVEVETPDHHYYHLAFFTTRKVKALEELTWDYGIDFDDNDHPVKAFKCQCGSRFCRNIKRSNRRPRRN